MHLKVSTLFLLNGNINISGGTPTLSSGGGGGAAGSILIESPKGIFTGTGSIYILGGYGGIDPISIFHGGAGSGGQIKIRTCIDNFVGDIHGKGGLTLLSRNYINYYSKFYNFSDYNLLQIYQFDAQKNRQILVAGGSGKMDRNIGNFNNTIFKGIMVNIHNNTNFLLLLNYIESNTQCIHDNNEQIKISTFSWNNVSVKNTDNAYIQAIASSLEENRTELYLSGYVIVL
jgi:hypothetical protein